MRQVFFVIVLACALALLGALVASADNGGATTTTDPGTTAPPALPHAYVQRLVDRYRHRVWHWQRIMQRPLTLRLARPPADPEARIHKWQRLARRWHETATNPPHLQMWLCIHRYEGAWTDDGPPYYGGLQMDLGFQRTYGGALLARKGTANRWTPLEQIWVAERALRAGRGFWPWPNSARMCGAL